MKAGSGIMNGFKYLFKVILYALTNVYLQYLFAYK